MTRIVAGLAGGRRLHTPPGSATRPTADRVREALFSSLGDLSGLRVLDLYAGSGALGLEALSRGAAISTLVEREPGAAAVIRRNVDELGLSGATVVATTVERYLALTPEPYDLVLADPPYAMDLDPVLAALVPWVLSDVVIERATRGREPQWPAGLAAVRSRKYGDTTLWYGRAL
ncbi:MAG TPA: 16S rRNA (guanine(966)-N(2))-methyltransferase RsmD [Mycobacteriales bacterium]|jgi:16S rRNA (guanine966-N2)-methyltransferase|nr:16S rRNA (guanine(966)-N(2))-methyltransferase RsmD [Mycobacteriales bacterium]